MSKKLEGLKYMLCKEMEEIADKGNLSSGDLDDVYKLSGAAKRLACLIEIEDSGSSGRGSYDGGSYRGRSYDRGGSYDGSYDGGSSGRHYVRGHYSRDNGKMREHLQRMLNDAQDNEEREKIQRFMDEMNR